jgi:HK97 family phage prohead protease
MLGGFARLCVDSLRAQLDAQRGQPTAAFLDVDSVLEGVMPEKAAAEPEDEPQPSGAPNTAPSSSGPANEPESAPPPSSEPVLIPPKGGIHFLADGPGGRLTKTTSHKMPHDLTRFRSLAHALALVTLAGGGVDADTRTALELVARDTNGPGRGGPKAGSDGLHMRTVNVRAVREDVREVDYVASSEAVDSHGEVLRQNWILERYLRNPVILWAHNNDWAVPTLPIGRAVKCLVENKQLLITPKFSEKNPFARIVFDMIVEGMLRAGSVGFRPHKVSREDIGGVERVVCDQNELYEFSICPVGSNPDALVLSAEERMVKAIEERSKSAILSLPGATAGVVVMADELAASLTKMAREQRAHQTSPAAAGNKDKSKTMKKKTLTEAELKDLVSRGIITHQCEGCQEVTCLDMPGLVKMAADGEKAVTQATAAEQRAATADAARVAAEGRATASEERVKVVETERAKAIEERDAATTLAKTNKELADKAISEKAALELGPLTGVETWQLSPDAAKRLAKRAATDPEGYAADVADVRAKGVAAGKIKSDVLHRVPATATTDPTPAVSELGADPNAISHELSEELAKRARAGALDAAAHAITST